MNTSMFRLETRLRPGTERSLLTGGDVGGGVGIRQPRHLACQAGLTRPAVETKVRDPRRRGQGALAVHSDVCVRGLSCRRGKGEFPLPSSILA